MPIDPISQNISGVQSLVGSQTNKIQTGSTFDIEGVGEQEDEFTLKLSDDELLELKTKWELRYRGYEAKLKLRQQANKTYYLGRQKEGSSQSATDGQPISANLLFEAAETFYPAALSKNPDPVVWADNTQEGDAIADAVKTMLQFHADQLVLRSKLTLVTRHWSIYFLGVMKHGWDNKIGDIKSDVIDPQCLILDPEATIDSYGDYDGAYIGERKTCTARELIELFPKHKVYITIMVDGRMGTDVSYTEWWSDEYCFYTFKDKVLDKSKNPHYNYDKDVPSLDPNGLHSQDIEGNLEMETKKGSNHFARPKKPYTFLSVFSLGDQPHDITGLIEQNIPNQRRVSRRTEQIDYNLSRQNNSDVFSGANWNQESAKQAAKAIALGHPVIVPKGAAIADSIVRLQAQGVDASFFTSLENDKTDLRSIFGTQGITSQPANENETARGMILNNQYDSSRIGGGIGDKLEGFVKNTFNWWVQLYYVYYDEPHFASVMGQMKATEYVELESADLTRRVVVSVSPDSMKPHDEMTEMNQALSLWEAGALDPKTLLTMLNIPDPQDTSESTVLWLVDKTAYMQLNFPQLAQQLAQIQQQQQAQMQQAQAQQGGGAPQPNGKVGSGQTPSQTPASQDGSVDPGGSSLKSVPLPK